MNHLTERKYSFVSTALPTDTFTVVEFKGEEGLSMPYRFEVLLAAEDPEINLPPVMGSPARFVIHRDEGDDVFFNGILSGFEQLHAADIYAFYRAVLVPKLWRLSLTHHNQVFLDRTVPESVEAVLKDGGLTRLDFQFRLQGNYAKQEYVCQYGETHLDFVSRWLEHEGIYYYFEQTEGAEKLIVTDTAISHTENPRGKNLSYSPPSGLSDLHREEIIQSFTSCTAMLPQRVLLRDYNYRKPSLELSAGADVDPGGRGEVYLYGEHFRTPEEGDRLAGIRAEELTCRKEVCTGDSTVPYVQPGYVFALKAHYREGFNRKYLTVRMAHEGSQTGYLIAGIRKGLSERESRVYYRNRFTAIPAPVQYRPERKTPAPRIAGTLSARIDGSGSGQYAELDSQGRYKVKLPFDLSGRGEGKASAWLRMAQPYAGESSGMHFPLHKGTEVLLAFAGGDPDRPVIAGAVPNPASPSPVTAENQTQSVLRTASGNRLSIEDRPGKERILLHVPAGRSVFRMGQPNDPDWTPKDEDGKSGWAMKTPGWISVFAGTSNTMVIGESTALTGIMDTKTVAGIRTDTTIGDRFNFSLGTQIDCVAGLKWKFGSGWTEMVGLNRKAATAAQREVAVRNEAMARKNETIAGLTETMAQNSRLIADSNRVMAENQALIGSKTTAIGTQGQLIARKDETIGAKEEAIAQKERAVLRKSEQIAERSQLIGNLTTTAAMEETLAVSRQQIDGAAEKITGLLTIE